MQQCLASTAAVHQQAEHRGSSPASHKCGCRHHAHHISFAGNLSETRLSMHCAHQPRWQWGTLPCCVLQRAPHTPHRHHGGGHACISHSVAIPQIESSTETFAVCNRQFCWGARRHSCPQRISSAWRRRTSLGTLSAFWATHVCRWVGPGRAPLQSLVVVHRCRRLPPPLTARRHPARPCRSGNMRQSWCGG